MRRVSLIIKLFNILSDKYKDHNFKMEKLSRNLAWLIFRYQPRAIFILEVVNRTL